MELSPEEYHNLAYSLEGEILGYMEKLCKNKLFQVKSLFSFFKLNTAAHFLSRNRAQKFKFAVPDY